MKTLHTAYRVTDLAVSLSPPPSRRCRDVACSPARSSILPARPARRTSWLTDPDGYRIELVQWPAGHPDGISAADFA